LPSKQSWLASLASVSCAAASARAARTITARYTDVKVLAPEIGG